MAPGESAGEQDPTGVAVIGLGVMGTRMLASLTQHDGFRPVSAWDPDLEARRVAGENHPELHLAESERDVVDADGVDLVYIATPPHAHHRYAQMAMDAGLPVYCEKPLSVDLAEGEELVETARERGISNAVNFPFAASPAIDHVQRLISEGTLGTVLGVDVALHFVPWPRDWQKSATWLADRADGGFLREVGSHFVFLIERLLGPAAIVDSSVTYPADLGLCETEFTARLDCSGVRVAMTGSAVGVGPDVVEMTIWGSERSVRLSNWMDVLVSSGGPWEPQPVFGPDVRAENNARFFDDLRNLVQGRDNTMASFRDALSVQRIVEAILDDGPS